MTNNHPKPDQEMIDRVVDAFGRVEVPPAPDPATTVAFLESAAPGQPDPSAYRLTNWRRLMRILPPLTAAAALLAGVIAFLVVGASPGIAFAEVLEKLDAINTATFKMTVRSAQGEFVVDCAVKNPGLMRQQTTVLGQRVTNIIDLGAGQMLTLVDPPRIATRVGIAGLPTADAPTNIIDEFRKIKAQDVVRVGEEVVEGQRLLRYDFTQGDYQGSMWVDPTTRLPRRSRMAAQSPGAAQATVLETTDFVWDPELDDTLFAMVVPDGYQTVGDDLEDPAVTDVTRLLELVAYLNDGVFPDQFDAFAMSGITAMFNPPGLTRQQRRERWMEVFRIVSEPEDFDAASGEQLKAANMALSQTISKGAFLLASLQESFDYHWTGAGVKHGDADTVICYWKTPDSGEAGGYTVIRGDLSVQTGVAEADLPGRADAELEPGGG